MAAVGATGIHARLWLLKKQWNNQSIRNKKVDEAARAVLAGKNLGCWSKFKLRHYPDYLKRKIVTNIR